MKPLNQNKIVKAISGTFIIGGLFVGLWWYYMSTTVYQIETLSSFNAPRDTEFVKKQFGADQYWLTNNTNANPEYMLKNITLPAQHNKYGHDVHTTVLFDEGTQAGFVSYYKQRFNQGKILFLSVDPNFRGKNFGKKLIEHAIEELKKLGCTRIIMETRISNSWARKLYTRVGFTQTFNDGDFVSFALNIKR